MTEPGEHYPFRGATMGDHDEALPRGEFNAAMASQSREIRDVKNDLAAIKVLIQTQINAKIEEARAEGRKESRLDAVEAKLSDITKAGISLGVAVAGLVLWRVLEGLGRLKP